MIDLDGYRQNVGIVIVNKHGQVLWARRIRQNTWQFPQGGVKRGETPHEAMYRELYEELGLTDEDVCVKTISKQWYKYKLPKRLIRYDETPVCLGQKQKWFLLTLNKRCIENITFDKGIRPEFDNYRFVSYWYPLRQVISFKRDVYRQVLTEFAPYALFGKKDD